MKDNGYFAMDPVLTDNFRWYALHTHPQQEDRAAENLNAWSVETFTPKYKERRLNPYTGRAVYFTRALFPRYIFARFDASRLLRKVWFTRGVRRVVGFGDGPTPIEDEIVELIKSRIGQDGFIQFNEELKPGDKVIIKDGPLADLVGVFERNVEDGDRVLMLLTAISYQGHVTIEKQFLKKIS